MEFRWLKRFKAVEAVPGKGIKGSISYDTLQFSINGKAWSDVPIIIDDEDFERVQKEVSDSRLPKEK